MVKKDRIISLAVVLLMLVAASLTVNKTLFGHSFEAEENQAEEKVSAAEAVTHLADGEVVIHTAHLPGVINGYAGPVPLDITIENGKIKEVTALDNVETPGFFKRASQLLDAWTGKTPTEAPGMQVDAISGATFSSNAIINNVNTGLAYYEGSVNKPAPKIPVKNWFALAVTLAACIVPLFVKGKMYHNAQMVANIIVLGFWCGQFLDYALILKFMGSGIEWSTGLVAIVMLIAAFIYPLFGKPQYYCTHICPLGSAQQLMAQVCGFKIHITPKTVKALDWFRRILWAALMLLLWLDCLTGWVDLELFQAFQFSSTSWWIIGAAIFFVLLSAVINRPYCRFVCPTGSLFKRTENFG